MRPHVIVSTLSAKAGGALTYVHELLPRLSAHALEHNELTFTFLGTEELLNRIKWPTRTRLRFPKGPPPRAGHRRPAFEKQAIEELHGNEPAHLAFIPYQCATPPKGLPLSTMIRNLEPFLYHKYRYPPRLFLRNLLLRHCTRRTIRRSQYAIAVSDYAMQIALQNRAMAKKEMSVVRHGVSTRLEPDASPWESEVWSSHTWPDDLQERGFLFAPGSFLPYRRFEDVLNAYAIHLKETPAAPYLIVAGPQVDVKYTSRIRKMADHINDPSPRVYIFDVLPRSHIYSLLSRCSAVILSSEIEACPNLALEASQLSSNIISTLAPPMPEFLTNACFYSPRDTLHLSQLLQGLPTRKSVAAPPESVRDWQEAAVDTYNTLATWAQAEV
jgi:glycosyltransferase involved in cell wall biosynthesis